MRNLKIYAMGLLFLLLMSGIALGGTRDPKTPDEKHLEFGKKFISVVKIRAEVPVNEVIVNNIVVKVDPDKPAAKVKHHASAVIIRPHWILTAAHVVENTQAQEVESGGEIFPLQGVTAHPEYATDNYGYYDLALGYSPRDFHLEFYTPLYDTDDELGKAITIAGFGWHGTFATGAKEYDGRRRAGSNTISCTERGVLICDAAPTARTSLEFLISPGDSGGGMFIGNKLAGINSFLIAEDKKPNGTYTDVAAFTRISLYAAWINKHIAAYELQLHAGEK